VLVLHRRVLDVLSLGDDEAASLGIDVGRARLVIVVAATLGTAAAVSVSGLIAFVGIIVPHTIRLLVSTSYRAVVPLSLLAGAGADGRGVRPPRPYAAHRVSRRRGASRPRGGGTGVAPPRARGLRRTAARLAQRRRAAARGPRARARAGGAGAAARRADDGARSRPPAARARPCRRTEA